MQHKVEFKLGETVHKQPITLIQEFDGTYTLKKQAVNQRDETDVITGLTKEVLKNMADVLRYKLTDKIS